MYRVVYYDRTVNASGLLAECISLEEAENIYKKVKEYWKDVYIERGGNCMRKDILKLMQEVQALAIEVSMKTKHDVFTNFYGNVNGIVVSAYFNGWDDEKEEHSLMRVYMDLDSNAEIKKQLRRTKRELKKLLGDR